MTSSMSIGEFSYAVNWARLKDLKMFALVLAKSDNLVP